MRKFGLALLFLLFSKLAHAGVACTLPFNLVNGQLADASQVMANYNALVTCLGSAAAAGANSDITSLGGLTTPIPPSQGGSPVFVGIGTSTGTQNAQVVTATSPPNFTLTLGYKVIFKAGFANTGPATLQIGSTPATAITRRTTDGIQSLQGFEILNQGITEVVYDGANFQLSTNLSPFPVGTVIDTISATGDAGWLLLQGTCVSTTVFTALWLKFGSPAAGSCTAGNFQLPDARGRVIGMIDSGGSGRITVAGGNFDGTALLGSGGGQNHVLTITELPVITPTGTISQPTITAHMRSMSQGTIAPTTFFVVRTGDSNQADDSTSVVSSTPSFTGNAFGSGAAHTNLPPIILMNKQIKY